MVTIKLDNSPRDIKRDRSDGEKYNFLKGKLGADTDKEVFKISFRVGFFKGLKEKIGKNPSHIAQLSTFSDEEIKEMIIVARYQEEDLNKIFDGKEVIKVCEEYANGGVSYLYNLFSETNKSDIQAIEEMVDEIEGQIEKH